MRKSHNRKALRQLCNLAILETLEQRRMLSGSTIDVAVTTLPVFTNFSDPVVIEGTVDNPDAIVTLSLFQDGGLVEGYEWTVTVGDEVDDGIWAWSYELPSDIADDTYDIKVTASFEDDSGEADLAGGLTVDTTDPIVTITDDGSLPFRNNTGTVALSGTYTEDNLDSIVVILNDGESDLPSLNAEVSGGTWTVDLSIAGLADGVYSVRVVATDLAGNQGSDDAVGTLTVDTTAGVTIDEEDYSSDSDSVTLTGTVEDDIVVLTVNVTGDAYDVTYVYGEDDELTVEDVDGVLVWSLALTGLAEGNYAVTVYAEDDLGNDATVTASLLVDATAPVVSIDSDVALPARLNEGEVTFSGDITEDNLDTIVVILNDGENDFSFDAVLGEGDDEGTWSLTLAISDLADGVYSIRVVATDLAGNEGSASLADTLTVDTIAGVTIDEEDYLSNSASVTLMGTVDADVEILTVKVADDDAYEKTFVYGEDDELTVEDVDGVLVWRLVLTDMADGDYVVTVYAKDDIGNETTIPGRLLIDVTAPEIAITGTILVETATRPGFAGTIDDPTATVVVTINGVDYDAVNNGDGTWSLAEGVVAALTPGTTYEVTVTATNAAGNWTTVTQDVTAGATKTVTLGGEFNKLTYVDANDVTVTVKAGKGEVIITFLTGDDYEAAVKGKAVTVTGTIVTVDVSIKDTPSVAISTKAPKGEKDSVTNIGTITIEGDIKTLNAPKVNLTGGIAVVEGEGKTGVIQTIKLNNISGNITMSAFAKGVAITATSMQGTVEEKVVLTTDFIKTLKVTSMTNCTINAKVIATVTVPTMIGCTINAANALKTLTVKTKFENTTVTSVNLQKATLTNVITDNGESAFGLRAGTFKQVTVTVDGGKAKTKWDFKKFNDEDNNAIGDFFITTTIVS